MKSSYDRSKLAGINNISELKEARRTVDWEVRLSEQRLKERADHIAGYFSLRHLGGVIVSKAEIIFAAVKTFAASYKGMFAKFISRLRSKHAADETVSAEEEFAEEVSQASEEL